MTTVHLVYPHGARISAPHAIGRKLGERLAGRYRVVYHDVDEARTIEPGPDEVLLGHPRPAPWTVFRRSARRRGWRRVLAMFPYNHGDLWQVSFANPIVRRCDLVLAITGNHWFETIDASPFRHWRPKMIHLDLAVDPVDFPRVKHAFAPPGRRRFLYVGHTLWYKNTAFLGEIARRMPETEIGWCGTGAKIPHLVPHGRVDFSTPEGRAVITAYDFLLTVGRADSNPTTILEAAAWGLVPVCTPESGYAGHAGIPTVPLGDAASAVVVLRDLQHASGARLEALRAANDAALRTHFTWERFAGQVAAAIESSASPPLGPEPRWERVRLQLAALASPYSPIRPRSLWTGVRTLARSMDAGRRARAWHRTRRAARPPGAGGGDERPG